MLNNKIGTATCQIILTQIGRTEVAVVDCPGFNDTRRSDTEVLAEIAKVLSTQYLLQNRLRLRGILWLRDITKTRMDGSDVRTLDLFSQLVGTVAFKHIVLVSTMWDHVDVRHENVAFDRELQLKDDFWRDMIRGGSYTQRFLGSKASAEGIISQLVGNPEAVVLQIQRELIDRNMKLSATAAGSVLALSVYEEVEVRESILQRAKARLNQSDNSSNQRRLAVDVRIAEQERDKAFLDKEKLEERVGMKLKGQVDTPSTWQEVLRTICSILGVSVQIIGVVLDVAGVTCAIM